MPSSSCYYNLTYNIIFVRTAVRLEQGKLFVVSGALAEVVHKAIMLCFCSPNGVASTLHPAGYEV